MKCVIAGGGTGGHLFPGMAIAEAFLEREMGNEVLFIGTERGIESKVLAGRKFPLRTIRVRPLKGRSLGAKVNALGTIPGAIGEAFSILNEFRPQVVLGVGGYASGPTLLAALLLRIKRAIHEQNLVPGMTNRLLKWVSQQVFVSFEESTNYFPKGKTWVTGTPVRKEFLANPSGDRDGLERAGGARFNLLVFGGSAGAQRINRAMMGTLSWLDEMKPFVRIVHQTGREEVEAVSKGYHEKGFDALVSPFFEEMASQVRVADLVICRSGASTIAELAVCGKAAILVPYPYAARQHQLINAQKLVDLGAARIIRDDELNGASLARTILDLYRHPEEREEMGEAIRHMGHPRAAQEIVDRLYALAN
jgi:UDP-N-acetylglucosamine--N-acetylmuramyl-(pentapeptide) pyrophosphoryl-undecaprenol N-acetylglucosamine transferase